MIEQGVQNVYQSENFKEYLQFLSKFHSYSLNNTILILSQYPSASLVAGYTKWQNDFQRNVIKGQKSIKILAPYEQKFTEKVKVFDENGKVKYDKEGNEVYVEQEFKELRFRIVNVFDVSQTDGKPLPELIHDLTGSSDSVKLLIETIKEACEIPIHFIKTNEDEELLLGAKGYYNRVDDFIVVNSDLDELQIAKTLAHEYSHSVLHKQINKNQRQREIEAESLAFIICNHFGIDTSDYSFTYIATYADADIKELKNILLNIQRTADNMIKKLEPIYERKRDEMIKDVTYITPDNMEKMSKDLVERVMHIVAGTPIYDYLRTKDCDEEFGKEELNFDINKIMKSIQEEFPIQFELYQENEFYRNALQESIFLRCYYDILNPKEDRPFIENSIERENYNILDSIARPVLNDKAYYMKLSTPHFDDFNIENIGDDRIALTHFYEFNGDLMADPDIEVVVDKENKLLIPKTYQQDNLQIFYNIDSRPELAQSLNEFIKDWLNNIKRNRFKINEIKTDDIDYTVGVDAYEKIKAFCEENGIENMLQKPKDKKRTER